MTVTINGSSGITAPEVILDNTTADGGQVVLKSSGYSNWNLDNYSGRIRAYYGSTEYFTINAAGNVGIGTSSPTYKVEARSDTPAFFGAVNGDGTRYGYTTALPSNSGNCYVGWIPDSIGSGGINGDLALVPRTSAGASIRFFTGSTSATERARIDSSGNLLVGTTSATGTFTLVGNQYNVSTFRVAANGNVGISWRNASNTEVGYVQVNASTTTYSTSSDYRLKENITPMTGALATVAQLKPCTYSWKATGEESQGFIAHELQAVVPECVVGEKDAVDEEGNPKYQGIDTSFLVATLTAAIQEQQAIIQTLTARIEALENK